MRSQERNELVPWDEQEKNGSIEDHEAARNPDLESRQGNVLASIRFFPQRDPLRGKRRQGELFLDRFNHAKFRRIEVAIGTDKTKPEVGDENSRKRNNPKEEAQLGWHFAGEHVTQQCAQAGIDTEEERVRALPAIADFVDQLHVEPVLLEKEDARRGFADPAKKRSPKLGIRLFGIRH